MRFNRLAGLLAGAAILLAAPACGQQGAASTSAEDVAPPALPPASHFTPVEDPRALGFDPNGLALLTQQFHAMAVGGVRPGYALILARGEQVAYTVEAGRPDLDSDAPFTIDTPVRIASMTKPVTSVATMMLIDDGVIALDDPVSDYIPAFADIEVAVSPMANEAGEIETRPAETVMTIRHLLTHTSGLGYIFDNRTDLGRRMMEDSLYSGEGDLAARIDRLAAMPLYADPGERWMYSYSDDVLGRVIEVAADMPFEDFLETRLFTPLGMHDTGFFFEDVDFAEEDLAPLYIHVEDGSMVLHDDGIGTPDWPSGGGGLVSTASDYVRFAMMLANGGALGEVRILSEESFVAMTSPQTTPEQLGENWRGVSYGFGVGVILPPEDGQEARGAPGDFYWGGFFDTDFFVSPSTRVAAVAMTQIQPGEHRAQPQTAASFRPLVYNTFAFD